MLAWRLLLRLHRLRGWRLRLVLLLLRWLWHHRRRVLLPRWILGFWRGLQVSHQSRHPRCLLAAAAATTAAAARLPHLLATGSNKCAGSHICHDVSLVLHRLASQLSRPHAMPRRLRPLALRRWRALPLLLPLWRALPLRRLPRGMLLPLGRPGRRGMLPLLLLLRRAGRLPLLLELLWRRVGAAAGRASPATRPTPAGRAAAPAAAAPAVPAPSQIPL